MATTFTLISSTVLTGSQATVTFSSIPSTYTDLVLRYSARAAAGGGTNELVDIKINSDTATNYSNTRLYGTGGAGITGSTRVSSSAPTYIGYTDGSGNTANTFGSGEIYIPSYTASQNKQLGSLTALEENGSTAYIGNFAYLWRNSAAITQLDLTLDSTNSFGTGSSFYLYGIKNA